MFELTGELDYMVPHMISIFTSKWVGDYLQPHSLYSLSQTLLGHPFYDYNNYNPKTLFTHTLHDVQPPSHTMKQITLPVSNGRTILSVLRDRLAFLHRPGLRDAGLMVVPPEGRLRGVYYADGVGVCVGTVGGEAGGDGTFLGGWCGGGGEGGGGGFECFCGSDADYVGEGYAGEGCCGGFWKGGCWYVCIVDDGRGVGVVIRKRFLMFMEEMARH
jgi:hypothetical protein